jgi:predicted GIY-YIG superfamily endonuclease
MDYKNGKIYKVQFDDGHFYIGSTAGTLRQRWNTHKNLTTTKYMSSCSRYMHEVGVETARIVLIEDYPCESKEHLRRKEDEHIRSHKDDLMCLNVRLAFHTPQDKKDQKKEWDTANADHKKAYWKEWYDKNRRKQNVIVQNV